MLVGGRFGRSPLLVSVQLVPGRKLEFPSRSVNAVRYRFFTLAGAKVSPLVKFLAMESILTMCQFSV